MQYDTTVDFAQSTHSPLGSLQALAPPFPSLAPFRIYKGDVHDV